MGQHSNANFSLFHHVLNRARWSALEVSRRLLQVLVRTFVQAGGTVEIVIDETLERRWGRKISKRGHYRDSLLESSERSVSNSGLRWITMALIVVLPWTKLRWALPFLSVLATTPAVSEALGKRHKTIAQLAQQMVTVVRRWLPEVSIKVIGDSAYSVIDLGLTCVKPCVSLIAPLRAGCTALCATSRTQAPSEGTATRCRETAAEFEYGAERPADAMGNHHREMVWRDRAQARSHYRHSALVFHRD